MPVHMSCQFPRNPHAGIHLGWEMHVPPGRTLSQTKYGHEQDEWPETTWKANPITIKPETGSHMAEQFSWDPLPCCSPPGRPFPIVFCFVSTCVSSDNSFLGVRQDPTLRPWKGSPFRWHHNRYRQIINGDREMVLLEPMLKIPQLPFHLGS